MLPTGHITISYLLSRWAKVDLKIAVAASLFPDVVDKPLKIVFHLTEAGRTYAHGLPLLLIVAATFALLQGWRAGYSWGMGHLFHLFADYPLTGYVPWFFPLVDYAAPSGGPPILVTWPEVVLDLSVVAVGIAVFWWSRRAKARLQE